MKENQLLFIFLNTSFIDFDFNLPCSYALILSSCSIPQASSISFREVNSKLDKTSSINCALSIGDNFKTSDNIFSLANVGIF